MERSLAMLKAMMDKAQLARQPTGEVPKSTVPGRPLMPFTGRQLAKVPTGETSPSGMPLYAPGATTHPMGTPGAGTMAHLSQPFSGARQLAKPGAQVQFQPIAPEGSRQLAKPGSQIMERFGQPVGKEGQPGTETRAAAPHALRQQAAQPQLGETMATKPDLPGAQQSPKPVLPAYGGEGGQLFGGSPQGPMTASSVGREIAPKGQPSPSPAFQPLSTTQREAKTVKSLNMINEMLATA